MRALPDRQRLDSAPPRLLSFQRPETLLRAEALGSTERFHAAVQEAKIGPDKDIPHITAIGDTRCTVLLGPHLPPTLDYARANSGIAVT